MARSRGPGSAPGRRPSPWSTTELELLIGDAIVDAYGDSEQSVGFYSMLEDYLAVPFTTNMLGRRSSSSVSI